MARPCLDGQDLQLRALQDHRRRMDISTTTPCAHSRASCDRSWCCAATPPIRANSTTRDSARSPMTSARLTMADVSHVGGLIAGGALANPLDAGFDVVTTTTHKSLRGPRGGMILCKPARDENRSGRVSRHAGRSAHECRRRYCGHDEARREPEFQSYAQQVLHNAQALAAELKRPRMSPDHGRHGKSPHRHRHGRVLRYRRSRRRNRARRGRSDREQTSDSGRSSSAATTERHSSRYARDHDARNA